jgi:3'-5' exonuclease
MCIGALIAHREDSGHWIVDALGAPHVGERSEKELIASFVDRIAADGQWPAEPSGTKR